MACYRVTNSDSGLGGSADYEECDAIESKPHSPPNTKKYHISAFLITFFSYALFHVTRKTFSNVKQTMSEEWSPFNKSYPGIYEYETWNCHNLYDSDKDATLFLGTSDTVFMVSYALGLFISGAIGDRLDLRKVLSFGMISSAITVLLFGYVSETTHTYNHYWYLIFWSLTGLLQSTGWPTVVAVVANWFGKSSRGLVMGVWGASPSVGNIIGAYTVAGVLHYGYQYAFLVPACMTLAGGVVVFFGLIPSPRDVGFPEVEQEAESPVHAPLLRSDLQQNNSARPSAIGFIQAFCLPGVFAYSLAYACLKLVNYSFFFWLPFYLHNMYGWPESVSDELSVWYDVGGIFGGILGGYISDKIGTRSPVVAIMLILSPPSLFFLDASSPNKVVVGFLMAVTGFFIGGVANLISTAISADLGRQKEIANSKEALATVTGIIDGTGSAGAAIGQILIPIIERKVGWHFVFYFFMIMTTLTLVFIIKIVYRDVSDLWHKRRRKLHSTRNSRPFQDSNTGSYSEIQ